MAKTAVYIDGFNVYHALAGNPRYHKYKWLNYQALAERYIGGRDTLSSVFYFTAFAPWNQEKMLRHQEYVSVLKSYGVNVILGKFKKKTLKCRVCGKEYMTYEEKLTDVNIALRMFDDARKKLFDKTILISGDTDIIPAINLIKSEVPSMRLGCVIPIGRKSEDMKKACHFRIKMNEQHLVACQLPDSVKLPDGSIALRPTSWT